MHAATPHTDPSGPIRWGFAALACAAAALIAAFAVVFLGPFAPVQDVGTSLGEITGNAVKSTLREVLNRPQPAPIARTWTLDDALRIAVVAVAVLALVLAALSYTFERRTMPAKFAVALGGAALLVLWLGWLALLVCAVLLIIAVVAPISEGVGGFLGGIGAFFGGLFGG